MDVLKDKVTIRYLKEEEYVQAVEEKRTPPRHLATYQLTAAGIQLLDDHEIPF
jgi:DNA-binding PadR family transcriptional regulator